MTQYVAYFVLGVLSAHIFLDTQLFAWQLLFACAVVALITFRRKTVVFFIAGFFWTILLVNLHLQNRLPAGMSKQHAELAGVITNIPEYKNQKAYFNFKPNYSELGVFSPKIRVSWFSAPDDLKPGQRWILPLKLRQPNGYFNPGGFDYEAWLWQQNITATAYVTHKTTPVMLQEDVSAWWSVDRWRMHISALLRAATQDNDSIGLIAALVIGQRQHINQHQWELLRKTGTVHLLAISGMHIGLISLLGYLLCARLSLYFMAQYISPKRTGLLAALACALLYAALAGFAIATVRALIMMTVAVTAMLLQRNIRAFRTWLLALAFVLLFDPLSLLSIGFCLSFSAVALIIYSTYGRRANTSTWWSTGKITLVTSLGLMPILLLYFQQISIISPIANIIAVPWVSFLVVPMALLASAVLPVNGFLGGLLLQGAQAAITFLLWVLEYLADLPIAVLHFASPTPLVLLLAITGVLLAFAPKGWPLRSLGGFLLLPLFLPLTTEIKSGDVHVHVLDVGQGLAVVVQTRKHVLLYDTGARYSENFNMGDVVVLPFLYAKQIRHIDRLLISHGDNDHIGGAMSVLEKMPVTKIIANESGLLDDNLIDVCRAGNSWQWDAVFFEILAPPPQRFHSDNNNSCVLRISTRMHHILLPGDIEKPVEQWLVAHKAQQLAADVLLAPHHGSQTSSSEAFLRRVKPGLIVISAGFENRFQHPHDAVLRRYMQHKYAWLNTAEQGAITIHLQGGEIKASSWRENHGHYWNR